MLLARVNSRARPLVAEKLTMRLETVDLAAVPSFQSVQLSAPCQSGNAWDHSPGNNYDCVCNIMKRCVWRVCHLQMLPQRTVGPR